MEYQHHKLIILGSGPSGYAAAIYAARAGLNPLLLTGAEEGGQLTTTTDVENWPGDSDGLQGPELMERMKKHAEMFDVQIVNDHIDEAQLTQRPFKLKGNKKWSCDSLIISTGASAKYLGLPSGKEFLGRGVSACATCDGFFFKDKDILVVGGGDSAMEEANFLTKFAAEVQIVHRRDALRASKIMQDRIMDNQKISIQWNTVMEDIEGNETDGVSSVILRDTRTDEVRQEPCDGVFLAIGHVPNTELFDAVLDLDDQKYIRTVEASSRTSIAGVFACGDVQDHVYRQAITAAGTGCMAAMDAEKYLESLAI